jgi:hypothetical protein
LGFRCTLSHGQILVNQIANEYDDYAEILIGQAERATQEATHWQQVAANTRKSHNKNHYQAMLDDTKRGVKPEPIYAFILALSAKLLKYCAFCSNFVRAKYG